MDTFKELPPTVQKLYLKDIHSMVSNDGADATPVLKSMYFLVVREVVRV